MVLMMYSGGKKKKAEAEAVKVEVEVETPLEDAYAPLTKRSKLSPQYNLLEEPSPLGLRLRKSPSLLELIEMRLSQSGAGKPERHGRKGQKGSGGPGAAEKLKAANFPASILKIGTWEYRSRYEGDLVAKCYYAKHKLVWEVLDGGLKNKIEIQWSDIMGLKASYPEDGPGTLDVVLARQPLFYRETNPQPRKHTLWQATSDFTNGQASAHRRHYLQCPKGMLGRHFEKLIQCDPRLNFLSQQPEITLQSPYFEPRACVFKCPSEFHGTEEENLRLCVASPSGTTHSSSTNNELDVLGRLPESIPQETPSPSSEVGNMGAEQWNDPRTWDNIRVRGLHTSMSMTDLVSHLEQRFSEHKGSSSNFPRLSVEEHQSSLDMLEELSRCLFNDSQKPRAPDEKALMSRVNSLCCLLQNDPSTTQNFPPRNDSSSAVDDHITSGCKQTSSLPRIDSLGELLLNLPRIASFPRFLFNIGEED